MFNRVILVGRISTELELRTTSNSKSYCRFNLAVNRMNEGTDFIPITVWGKSAENLVSYQNKGSLILVDGSISMSSYTDKDGNNRTSFEVMTSNVQFLSNKRNDNVEENTTEQSSEVMTSNVQFLSNKRNDNVEENTTEQSSDPFEEFGEQIILDDLDDELAF